jgi:hypothetical protein
MRMSGNVGYTFPARTIVPNPVHTSTVVASERSRVRGFFSQIGEKTMARIRFILSSLGKNEGFIPLIRRVNAGASQRLGGST